MASYGVENPVYATIQLAHTTMTSELGKITLHKTNKHTCMCAFFTLGCKFYALWYFQEYALCTNFLYL